MCDGGRIDALVGRIGELMETNELVAAEARDGYEWRDRFRGVTGCDTPAEAGNYVLRLKDENERLRAKLFPA